MPTETVGVKQDSLGNRFLDVTLVDVQDRARKEYKGMMQLQCDLVQHTLISPISVSPASATGRYRLIAGGRRYAAFSLIATHIPFVIRQEGAGMEELDRAEGELHENYFRQDLSWAEESYLMEKIDLLKRKIYGATWSTEKTAALFEKDPSHVGKDMNLVAKLNALPEDVRKILEQKPKAVAIREMDRIEAGRRAAGRVASGDLKIEGIIVNKAAQEWIEEVPLRSVKLWLMDPPYGEPSLPTEAVLTTNSNMPIKTQIRPHDNLTQDTVQHLLLDLYPKIYNRLKPGGYCLQFFAFHSYSWIKAHMEMAGFTVDSNPLIWDKIKPAQQVGGFTFLNSYEPILVAYRPPAGGMNKNLRNVISVPKIPGTKRLHPFQKPEELLGQLIECLTHEGDIVADCFAGSGSTIRAATKLKRNGIGCEIDEENYHSALINLSPIAT